MAGDIGRQRRAVMIIGVNQITTGYGFQKNIIAKIAQHLDAGVEIASVSSGGNKAIIH